MSLRNIPHLVRRGGVFCFRMAVPRVGCCDPRPGLQAAAGQPPRVNVTPLRKCQTSTGRRQTESASGLFRLGQSTSIVLQDPVFIGATLNGSRLSSQYG